MAEPKKNNLPKILIGAAIVGGIAFMATGGTGGSDTTTVKAAPKSASRSSNSFSLLTGVDPKARPSDFTTVVYNMPDRFAPLIYKAGGPERQHNPYPISDLQIGSNFTGGEQGWAFTGTVSIDGKWKALVENSTSGKDDYVVAGQKWKSSTVDKVTENILTLRDLSGQIKDVSMQADVQARISQMQADLAELKSSPTPARTPSAGAYAPMNPLVGNIGLQQDENGATIVGAATADGSGGGYGGFGGGRRNRGGGRGGRGGGGRGGRGGGG